MRRRFLKVVALALAVAVLFPAGAWAQTRFFWQIVDEAGRPYTGENVQCSVFRPNIHAAAVLHTNRALTTSAGNPLWGDVTGTFHFWSSISDPLDVSCFYNYGGGGFSGRIDQFTHKIVLPRQGVQISRFAVNSVSATYQTDSGLVLPQGALIQDVIIQNLNPQGLGTYHLSVGFLGNHAVATSNSLVTTQALSSPDEWLRPHMQEAASGTGALFYFSGTHRGAALVRFLVGHANGIGDRGIYTEKAYLVHVATGLQVSYSAQPGTGAGLRAHVLVIWQRLHSQSNRLPFGIGK